MRRPPGTLPRRAKDVAVRGALLDVDGTLLDSNDAHARSYVDALATEGIEVPFARVRRLIGMGSDKVLAALGVDPHSRTAEHVERAKKEGFSARYLPALGPFHGARDLLQAMKKRGLTLTVATSAGAEELHALLRAAGIADLIDAQSTSSDAEASKPDPDIVEAAIARSKHAPEELVMLGDTPYDVEAAGRPGVSIIALRTGGWSDPELAGAAEIYNDPAELLSQYERSILARG
jgi:HAD superfamily hydrolase (TIGR01509 family)